MPLCDGFLLSGKLKALFRIKHTMLFIYVRLVEKNKKRRKKYIHLTHTVKSIFIDGIGTSCTYTYCDVG